MSDEPMQQSSENSVIFIGAKPVMNYVLAVLTQFNKEVNDVTLKARGRSISRAVDTAEIARNRFMPNLKIKNITIGTESIQGEQGDSVNVSSMEITLTNQG
jgi:archaea-specific DNA-binding protein